MQQIFDGILKFQSSLYPHLRNRFKTLAGSQQPHTLFITCCDSRVVPNLITQTLPGELFVSRTIGNIVPPSGSADRSVSSAIEYAVNVLKVSNIVVCGHSDCGAMKAVLHPESQAALPETAAWLHYAGKVEDAMVDRAADDERRLNALIRHNVVIQADRVRSHPSVSASSVQVIGLVYDIASGAIADVDSVNDLALQGAA